MDAKTEERLDRLSKYNCVRLDLSTTAKGERSCSLTILDADGEPEEEYEGEGTTTGGAIANALDSITGLCPTCGRPER